jgi:prevent-host-death family protein
MNEVSVRNLRNDGGRILDRVEQGETLVVTRNRRPVAELRPIRLEGLPAELILQRWRGLPDVDLASFRADIDSVVDTSL